MVNIGEILEDSPVIAAIRDRRQCDLAVGSSCGVVFMLCGSILDIEGTIKKIKDKGKKVCVHVDFIEGLGRDNAAVEFLKRAGADGIITTKPSLVKDIRAFGMFAIQRLFIIDSRSLATGIKSIMEERPDAVEIMPGIAAKVIPRIHKAIDIPVIAGGLIMDKSDIIEALSKGAIGVSTSEMSLLEE